jgi:hypothetical protein
MKLPNMKNLTSFRGNRLFLYDVSPNPMFIKRFGSSITAHDNLQKQSTIYENLPKNQKKFVPKPFGVMKLPNGWGVAMKYIRNTINLREFYDMNPTKKMKDKIENQLKSLVKSMIKIGYLHRALKPQHILVNLEKKHIVLVDFSLAKHFDEENFKFDRTKLVNNDNWFYMFNNLNDYNIGKHQLREKNLFNQELNNRFNKIKK